VPDWLGVQLDDDSYAEAFGRGQDGGEQVRRGVIQAQHGEAESVRYGQFGLDELGRLSQIRRPAVTSAALGVRVVAGREEAVRVDAAPDGPFHIGKHCRVAGQALRSGQLQRRARAQAAGLSQALIEIPYR
jgi:hypothetical protein